MKIYIVSISAHAPIEDAEGEQGQGSLYMHVPGIIPAETIEAAADLAREQAFALWPSGEGWVAHQALIIPVTKAFFDAAMNALKAGCLDMSPEPERSFKFVEGQRAQT